jgi:hypothetical protein
MTGPDEAAMAKIRDSMDNKARITNVFFIKFLLFTTLKVNAVIYPLKL